MKPQIKIVSENMVEITTPSGQKFQIVCKDNTDNIVVFANSSFGSALILHPRSGSSVMIKEERI